jgi:hypothetical protein
MPDVVRGRSVEDGPMTTHTIATPHSGHAGHRGWLRFTAHYVEMLVVMFLGMGVLGAVFGTPHSSPIEVQALSMTVTMTVPMVGWMLFRGHSRRASAEMGLAMVVPLAVLLPLLWADLISADGLFDLMHIGMLPTMLAAMLFRGEEYGRP